MWTESDKYPNQKLSIKFTKTRELRATHDDLYRRQELLMKIFKRNAITQIILISGIGLTSLSNQAIAQEPQIDEANNDESTDQVVEVIEVQGFSTSLIKSLNQKRFSDTVTEQISADDLGGLPDVSIADALTRLPGISAVRTGGQAAEINIRGLAGDFVFSTLNGREQVSTTGSRSIDFSQYPSELISSGIVYKSPKASLIEGGVAGSIELTTASPLSNDQTHVFNVNVRGMYNNRAEEVSDATEFGHRLSFAYQGQFLDNTLGLALGYARLFQPSVSTQFIGLAYNQTLSEESCTACEGVLMSEGFEMQHKGGEEIRDGYVTSVEWAPTNNFTLKGDVFYSKFDKKEFARGYRVKLEGLSASISNPTIIDNHLVGATVNRLSSGFTRVELVNDNNQDFDEILNIGVNAKWQLNDNLLINFDVSKSSAENDFRNGLLWSLVASESIDSNPQFDENISISYLLNGLDLPDLGFNQADAFSDVNRVWLSKYGIYPFQNKDDLDAYRIDFVYELDTPIVSSVEFGLRYSEREYSNRRSVYEFGSDSTFLNSQAPLALDNNIASVVDWQGEFAYFPSYLAINQGKALQEWFGGDVPQPVQSWGGFEGVLNPDENVILNDTSWSVLESGKVFEDISSAYIMANLDFEIANVPVTGNAGVRRVTSKQASSFYQDVDGDVSAGAQNITDDIGLVTDEFRLVLLEDKYTDYLPSLNLNFQLRNNHILRFAAAKVMGRPPINEMFANARVDISLPIAERDLDTGEITLSGEAEVSGQNSNSPYLRPFYANQFDLSYEYYFEETDGALVIAAYYKDIKSFIDRNTTDPYDFRANGFVVPDEIDVLVQEQDPNDPDLLVPVLDANGDALSVSVPVVNGAYTTAINNSEGGYIRGSEIAYTQIFSFLPELWAGLGMNLSYSYTETEIVRLADESRGIYTSDLPGLSKNVFSGTLFWEYEGFETRVNARYRDPFVSQQVAVNSQVVNFDSELVVDFQASYSINENTSVLFQANNITDEPTKSYFGDKSRTGTIQYFGTQFFLGLTYSL